jgi:hypothetical protein
MPLETLVYFSKLAESNPEDMPLEGREIIAQLEKLVHQNGMGVVYESRKNAPRASNVNPNIFHHRVTFAEELANEVDIEEIQGPIITYEHDSGSEERAGRIKEYLKNRIRLFETPGENWEKSLRELENIVADYHDSVSVQTLVNTPWRVWGEVKRHRTLKQNSQSIYRVLDNISSTLGLLHPSEFISVPLSASDGSNFKLWEERAVESILAYETLINAGIPESDAVALIPRGIKFPVIKDFDLYNLTTGYSSLRTCRGTVEPEMRAITEEEMNLVRQSEEIEDDVKSLLAPKCHYSGFCPESDYKICCGLVKQVVPVYNEEMHKGIWAKREAEIRAKL